MYPRVNYEMTEDDLGEILNACKPTMAIMVGNYVPAGPQENANRAWERLGKKMGFDYMTVQPIDGKGNRFFSAVPTENAVQKEEREKREEEERRLTEIKKLRHEISEREARLYTLERR